MVLFIYVFFKGVLVMKAKDIEVGFFFGDKKFGLREVLSIVDEQVFYRVLSAKMEKEYCPDLRKMVSTLGESDCLLSSFAAWSKEKFSKPEADKQLSKIKMIRTKLSPAQVSFLESLAKEFSLSEMPSETASIDGLSGKELSVAKKLSEKGFFVVDSNGVSFTGVGLAWLESHLSEK